MAPNGHCGLGWDDVLPYFTKSEHHYGEASEFHGHGGELLVEEQRLSWPILDSVAEAAGEIGVGSTDDFNQGNNEGVGYFPVNQKKGVRWNSRKAFLDPARGRSNLQIITQALVERLCFNGRQVAGVEFRPRGVFNKAAVNREVILAAGSIGSAQIL